MQSVPLTAHVGVMKRKNIWAETDYRFQKRTV
jgi:hypothetical protein